ncbi:MAG: DUF3990 domain-containing protein [Muribaculaceae bacterium]|nr:DUF3990 domain-containing protein [Muribaculaceae bacterium]
MKLYHTSNTIVRVPDISHSRKHLDFGEGFYLTSLESQAIDYGRRFILRGEPAFMNIYYLADEIPNAIIKEFNEYDGQWLDFITACRKGLHHERYDIIIGGIADDQVFDTVDLYLQGKYNREQALDQLIWKKPNHQICITSQSILDNYLEFIDFITL